jgi:hypothetical protein
VTAVTCPSSGPCLALADVAGRVTTLTAGVADGPWTAGGALPATVSAATGISCVGPDDCWATVSSPVDVAHAVGGVAATGDGGATWTLQTVPPGTGMLSDIDCTASTVPVGTGSAGSTGSTAPAASRTSCTAVGTTATVTGATRSGQGLVLTTADAGVTWSPAAVTATSAALFAVSCGAGPCVAVGTTVATVPAPGVVVLDGTAGSGAGGWRRAAVATVPLPLTGVSCRSLSSCVVVGESGTAYLSPA